jgi:H+/Cl- antiporter ClcA
MRRSISSNRIDIIYQKRRFEGVGYATVQDVLQGGLATAPLLGLLFLCKLTATSLSLGSGSSGGIFSPSLFMGATLGGAFGAFATIIFPSLNLSVPALLSSVWPPWLEEEREQQ